MAKILIICPDIIGRKMAGPAIRYLEMAKAISRFHEVTLAVPSLKEKSAAVFPLIDIKEHGGTDAGLRKILRNHSFVLLQPFTIFRFPCLKNFEAYKIFDLYDPYLIELLEHKKAEGIIERTMVHEHIRKIIMDDLALGDYFICASERQRNFWLGMLLVAGKINPRNYECDTSFWNTLGIVPFGMSETSPSSTGAVIKGVLPGIGAQDKVVIWGGGLWNWLDPQIVIKAMAELKEEKPHIKLFFMGSKHPNPNMPQSLQRTFKETLDLAEKLKLLGENVFFNNGWVPYEERGRYLLEADAGISAHFDNLETRYSFRTRILDYLWAGLPIITSEGDHMADLVKKYNLGMVVGYGDATGMKKAVIELLELEDANKLARKNIERVREAFTWDKVCRPLFEFMDNPRKLPEPIKLKVWNEKEPSLTDYGRFFRSYWSHEGPIKTFKRVSAFLGRRF